MTLQRPVVAQLALQAGLTYKVRLAPAFKPSALTTGLFAVSSVLRAGCGCPFVDRLVAPRDGRIASLSPSPWLGSTCGTGKALRCCPGRGRFYLRDGRDATLPPWMGLLDLWGGQGASLLPGEGWGYGFSGFHAFVGRAFLWPLRGVIAVVNTLLCVWGIVSAGRVARRGFD